MSIYILVFVLKRLCKGESIKIFYAGKEYPVGNLEANIIIKIRPTDITIDNPLYIIYIKIYLKLLNFIFIEIVHLIH